jgi:hypothetical protein
MNDYDGIHNCNGLIYSPSKKFDKFDSLFLWGSKHKVKKDFNTD